MSASGGGDEVVIGEIARAHGIRGVMRVRATGPTLSRLGRGDPVRLLRRDGVAVTATIERVSGEGAGMMLQLQQVADRDAAEALRGALIRVAADRLPRTDEDEFYVRDLIGCRVELVGGRLLGHVSQVHPGPANDVLEVTASAAGEPATDAPAGAAAPAAPPRPAVLVPFTRDAVTDLDLAARRIVVREGLLGDPDGA